MEEKKTLTPEQIERGKRRIADAVRWTIRDIRRGMITPKVIGKTLDENIYPKEWRDSRRREVTFAQFGDRLRKKIQRSFAEDHLAKKMTAIVAVVDELTDPQDFVVLERLRFELEQVPKRVEYWRRRLQVKGKKGGKGKK